MWTKLVGLDAILLLHGDVATATVYLQIGDVRTM